jgi:predicted DNA repair protein MutK
MAGSSLLALIDDIASILDDVSVLTKTAAAKTSGVLGDDLALNAQQVSGVNADREIPVVIKVAKGSFVNKLILIPIALLISTFIPMLVNPLLMIGGAFLCFEGFEKVFEKFFHTTHDTKESKASESEEEKIKGAIRTDFILSAEIIVIALGTIAAAPLLTRILTLFSVGIGMTFGVYGLVALIVKIDDFGLYLIRENKSPSIGKLILKAAPLLMKGLGIAGTVAMFLVGGGIIKHGVDSLLHSHGTYNELIIILFNGLTGVISGGVIFATVEIIRKLKK